jgi:hypothetical protein
MDDKLKDATHMGAAYAAAGKAFRARLRDRAPEDEQHLRETRSSEIVVVRGHYDQIERVLRATDVPHLLVEPAEVDRLDWAELQVLMVSCPGNLSPESVSRIAAWVRRGGYLVTTDWALKHVIEPAFPGTVRHNGRQTSDCVVRVELQGAADDPLLAGFLEDGREPLWWLEGSSYPIDIVDPARVRVLIRSREVGTQWGAEPVVVTFEEGEGTVLHMLSHLYLQRSDVRGARDAQPAAASVMESAIGLSPAAADAIGSELLGVNAASLKSAFTTAGLMAGAVVAQKRKLAQSGKGRTR